MAMMGTGNVHAVYECPACGKSFAVSAVVALTAERIPEARVKVTPRHPLIDPLAIDAIRDHLSTHRELV